MKLFQRKISQTHKKVRAVIDLIWLIYFVASIFATWMLSKEFTLIPTFILGVLISISMRYALDVVVDIIISFISMRAILENLVDEGVITSEQKLRDFYDLCKREYKQGINDRHQKMHPYVRMNIRHCTKYMKKQGVTTNEDQTV